ncbi:MAG: PAS domain-containing protein [Spirochaetales bacterium]|nr:PAS domain-containing protein [Spirochaetales bacterium]
MKFGLRPESHRIIFVSVLITTTLLLVIVGWLSWESYGEWRETATAMVRLQELIGLIKTSDEILTMSARMAAATGDPQWEERYHRTEPELDEALKEAMRILPDSLLHDAISKTDEANRILVSMEKNAFALIRNNRREEAETLCYTRLNRAGEEFLGVSRQELLGRDDSTLFSPDEAALHRDKDRTALRGETPLNIPEEPVNRGTGKERVLHTIRLPLKDGEGVPEYLLCISEDITQRREAERAMKRLEEDRIRTQKIESLGILAGDLAHDFNNLHQGIFGFISLAKQEKDNPELCGKMLNNAEEAMEMAIQLTNRLLTFSKGGNPHKREILLPPLIERTVDQALIGTRARPIIRTDRDLWPIHADEDQIAQVIRSIIIIADQSMPDGGEIRVEAENRPFDRKDLPPGLPTGPYVILTVRDRGVGIADGDRDRIFKPYFTTREMGSGLGLAVSYSIVKNHKGTITLESERDKGSLFSIWLPAAVPLPLPSST